MAGKAPPSVDEILDRLNKGAGPKFDYIQNPDGTIEVRNINGPQDAETAIAFLKALGSVNAINEVLAERDRAQVKPATKKGLTLKEALAIYTVAEAGTVKEWDARLRALNSFIGKMGADTRVTDVSRPLAAEWANGLMLNGGMQKKTASGYVSHCAQLFKFLIQQGHLENNPVKGVVVVTAREKKMHKRQGRGWEPLEEADLKRIFDPANFARTETQHARWGMLLMLYSGARVGEVAQIHLRDFEMRDGHPCLKILTDSDGQSVKTDDSERLVPLHPDLLRFGVMERVENLREAGEDRFFPGLNLAGKAGVGSAITKAFGYYLKDMLKIRPRRQLGRLGTHSIRKNVIHALQGCDLSAERRRALVGHEADDPTPDVHEVHYMRSWTAKELAVFFPGLKWGEWLDVDGLKNLLETTVV